MSGLKSNCCVDEYLATDSAGYTHVSDLSSRQNTAWVNIHDAYQRLDVVSKWTDLPDIEEKYVHFQSGVFSLGNATDIKCGI